MDRSLGIMLLVILIALSGCKRGSTTSSSDSPVVSQDSKPVKNADSGTKSKSVAKDSPPPRKLEGNAEKIIGVWNQTVDSNPGNTCTIEFCRDGSFKIVRTRIVTVLDTREWIDSQGTYEVDGDKIKMLVNTKDGLRSRLLTIKKVESDQLVTFERAPVVGGGFMTREDSMTRKK